MRAPVLDSAVGERYDLVVIGAGPAGERAQAAYFGRRVAIVNGDSVYRVWPKT